MKMRLLSNATLIVSFFLISCREKLQEYKPVSVVEVLSPTIVASTATITRLTRAVSVENADTVSLMFAPGQNVAINPSITRLDTLISQRIVANGSTMEINAKVSLGSSAVPFKKALFNFRFGNAQSLFRFEVSNAVYNLTDSTIKLIVKIPSSIAPVAGSGTSPSPLVMRYAIMNAHDSISNVIEEPLTIVQAGGNGSNFLVQKAWNALDFSFEDTLNCGGKRHQVSKTKNLNGVILRFLPDGTAIFSASVPYLIARCDGNAPILQEISLPLSAGWLYNNRTREITIIYRNGIRQVWHVKEYNDTYFEVANRFDTDVAKFRFRFYAQ